MTSWKNNNTLKSRRLVEEVLDSSKKTRKSREVVAKNKKHLQGLILRRIESQGSSCDLNSINVSNITDMRNLFSGMDFNGDISGWDVSNVTDMTGMFSGSTFNGDISNWDVSSVDSMHAMFYKS